MGPSKSRGLLHRVIGVLVLLDPARDPLPGHLPAELEGREMRGPARQRHALGGAEYDVTRHQVDCAVDEPHLGEGWGYG